ncbi:MAG TPA: hypothetical protein VKQ72_22105 [Aggregatilineales bacterium]|nr:hypothetical protein [Aggregatilineales bacterium]
MDLNQVARMIEWLDEERRRDKALIVKLEEQISHQQETVDILTRRLGGVESDQSGLRASVISMVRESDIPDQLRLDMQKQIEASEAKRLAAEREAQRREDVSREGQNKLVRDVTERLEKLERTAEESGTMRVERDRFAQALTAMQQRIEDVAKKFEDSERRVAFLEEQRRQDTRRLSEAQSELPDIKRDLEGVKAKLDLLEDMSLKNEKKLLDVQNTERDRREQIEQFIEQQTLMTQQRDLHIQELTRNFSQYDDEMRTNLERFETWTETHRLMKRSLEDFERIGDRLERRINEVAETQRLSEERFRQEWNSWNDDDQKRWKQFTLTNDESWRLHDKEYDQFRTKVGGIESQIPVVRDQIERLWRVNRAYAQMYREHFQEILTEHDQPAEKTNTNGNGRK